MKRIVTAAALIALLVVAAPASAKQKTQHYSGKTDDGNSISFSLKGNRISDIHGYVTTTCVPDRGTPTTGPAEFNPPGSYRLGRTRKVSETHYVSWWGDTTFNDKISIKKRRGGIWAAKLHTNYSYIQYLLPGGGQVDRILFVCQGDDGFSFKP
ncbi:MAG: hypothetical protein QOG63_1811 [Thermoleophilaceae bacterium]|jgi:hypothetical protein|nr:hypothetical protein [Thermoleophilaceae bacterium]